MKSQPGHLKNGESLNLPKRSGKEVSERNKRRYREWREEKNKKPIALNWKTEKSQ